MSISPSAMASRCFVVLAFLLPLLRFLAAFASPASTGVAVPEGLLPSSKWPSPVVQQLVRLSLQRSCNPEEDLPS